MVNPAGLISKEELAPAGVILDPQPGDQVFNALVPESQTGPEDAAVHWQAAVDALAANAQSGDVIGVGLAKTSGEMSNGYPSFRLNVDPSFQPWSATDAQAETQSDAQAYGLKVVDLAVENTAAGPAVLLTATPAQGDATAFIEEHPYPTVGLTKGGPVFVQVVDSNGTLLDVDSDVPQISMSFSWIDPSIPGCYGTATYCAQQEGSN